MTQQCLEEGKGIIEKDTAFARILKGSRSVFIFENGFDKTFSTYGLLKRYNRQYIRAVVQLLRNFNIKCYADYVVLAGEKGNEGNILSLIEALASIDANVRRLACSALGKLGSPLAELPLIGALFDSGPQVRQYAITALGKVGSGYSLPILQKIVTSKKEKSYNVRAARDAIPKINSRN